MTARLPRRQELEGVKAGRTTKNGSIQLFALDFSGREIDLYIENLPPPQGQNRQPTPKFFCPICGDGLLGDKGITGPNSQHTLVCPVCDTKFKQSEDMPRGIGITMA